MRTLGLLGLCLTFGCSSSSVKRTYPAEPNDSGFTQADDTGGTDETGDPPDEPCSSYVMEVHEGEALLPSVVRIAFKLTCDGSPVPDKTEDDFTIQEDGDTISQFESAQQLIPTVAGFQLSTLLLIDMSGSMVVSGRLPDLQEAASAFIDTLGEEQTVAIYTFDGREDISRLVPFTTDRESLHGGIASLTDMEVVDASTNLNGAVIEGLEVLSVEADLSTEKLFGGSMALFTDGSDQAGRVSDEDAVTAAAAADVSIYTIGLGAEIDTDHLSDIGKDGAFFADEVDGLTDAFDTVAADILADANALYILAYCSPKRAGEHELTLSLNDTDATVMYTFSAEGFEGGCDPNDFVPPEFLDLDEDGYRPYDGDCDDEVDTIHPGAEETCNDIDDDCDGDIDEDGVDAPVWYADSDLDGFGNPDEGAASCEQPSGTVADATDCDDERADTYPGAIEVPYDGSDNDCDASTVDDDLDGDGYGIADDCNDDDADVRPGAEETCNDVDDDCDGEIDEEPIDGTTYYIDSDGDGYGVVDATISACAVSDGYSATSTDCDDERADTHPGATEVPYDGADNDCDASTPDDDLDGDGYGLAEDCDDTTGSVSPSALETCNGVDDDCDGDIDEGLTLTAYRDADGDGYGDADFSLTICDLPHGYVLNDEDCDDTTALARPGMSELCDGIDNDCSGVIDDVGSSITVYVDGDGDGYGLTSGMATISACEVPDGFAALDGDCDDGDPEVRPGASEYCNETDNDCDGEVDEEALDAATYYKDDDGDGYGVETDTVEACVLPSGYADVAGDLDDTDPEVGLTPPSFVRISAGAFDMGCTATDEATGHCSGASGSSEELHGVVLTRDFYIQRTEVTQGEFMATMGYNPSSFDGCGDDCPVEDLTWNEAAAYANQLSYDEGYEACYECDGSGPSVECSGGVYASIYDCPGYRLPTEAEWEFSARCGTDFTWAGSSDPGEVAWYGTSSILPVAEKIPNDCGLYDMSGNVWEWIHEHYSSSYYSISPRVDPEGPSPTSSRLRRGGGYSYPAGSVRVASRNSLPLSSTRDDVGVRVVRTAE